LRGIQSGIDDCAWPSGKARLQKQFFIKSPSPPSV
jgi:hypothetical protein